MTKQRYSHRTTNGISNLILTNGVETCQLGIEVGSLETFFSFENPQLGDIYLPDGAIFSGSENGWQIEACPVFSDANILIAEGACLSDLGGLRRLTVSSDRDTLLMDSVLRFTFDKVRVKAAYLNETKIKHRSENRYHQRASCNVRIEFKSGWSLDFCPTGAEIPQGMECVTYLRDERQRWVLHFRALSIRPTHYLLKGCHRLWNRKLPGLLQALLLSCPAAVRHLLYVRERVSQRIPIQLNGAVALRAGERISLGVEWKWSKT